MLKPRDGGIYRSKTSRMTAVYNDKTEILHIYYGLDIRARSPEEVEEVLKGLCLESSPLVQFQSLLSYISDKAGNCDLSGNLMNWGRNIGLSNREIANAWVDRFFPE